MRSLTSALALAAILTPFAATAEIGTVAAVNREMEGTPPIENTRLLVLGDTVYQDELVETSDSGSGQLMFVDQTTITIGPDSSVLLDRFIYDSERQTGDIAASMAQGALRFIGGKITKFNAAEIRTPTATIAIRGGMVLITVDCTTTANCRTSVTNVAGSSVKVSVYGDSDGDGLDDGPAGDGAAGAQPLSQIVLSRPGAEAEASGGTAKFTGLATPGKLATKIASLDGAGTGGVGTLPGDDEIESGLAVIAPVGSGAPESPYAEPASTTGESDDTGDSGETVQDTPDSFFDAGPVAELIGIPGEVIEDPQGGGEPIDPPEEPVDPPTGGMIPDPGVVAALTGTALYNGTATGVNVDLIENISNPVTGSFTMSYNFGSDTGALDINIAGGVFSTDVASSQGSENFFSGVSDILGGPGTFAAVGNFVEGAGDPVNGVEGNFGADLQQTAVTGVFEGTK